ncbi:MAG: mandelate racemase/muconate lactonizing enzyme family protein [Planctomycetes bacterium]|nr:mandelate racemase/muconate lactonizing enzyme family protein [Planctomycetota bacterium]
MQHPTYRPTVSRRRLLKSIGAAAAGAALLPAFGIAEDNPSAEVEDKATNIRVTELHAFVLTGRVILKINTNFGVSGWGEIKHLDLPVAAMLARSMFNAIKDENPTRIEYLWQKMYRAHRDQRGGPFMVSTIAGIDMALWDIAGKLHRVPVYRLLGGPTRSKIRFYPTAQAKKIAPGGPRPFSGTPRDIKGMVDHIKQIRKQVGPDGAVMFDAHSCLPPATVIQFANAIEPYDVLFIEEPWVPGNIEVAKRIRKSVRVPLATGERDRTIWGLLPYLHEGVVDILQPDVGPAGGISQMKKIAAIAEAYHVPLAPHNGLSALGLTASFHVVASIPMFLIHEGYLGQAANIARKNWTIDKNGYASLPEGVGLCVDVDEKALVATAAEVPKGARGWSSPRLEDGSVADY